MKKILEENQKLRSQVNRNGELINILLSIKI